MNDIVSKYLLNVESYANDTLLSLEFQPTIESLTTAKLNLEQCTNEIKNHLFEHQLKLNKSKTEIIIIESKHFF